MTRSATDWILTETVAVRNKHTLARIECRNRTLAIKTIVLQRGD